MPAIVRAGKKAPVAAATDDDDRKSAIVTAKNPRRGSRFGDVPDMAPALMGTGWRRRRQQPTGME